jgi:transcriptional regulator NrdR family protein
MEHMKGGRGKRAPYRSVVTRVPEPLIEKVDRLIMDFHEKLVTGLDEGVDNKPVTSNNLISAVQEIITLIESESAGFKLKSAKRLIEAVLALKQYL